MPETAQHQLTLLADALERAVVVARRDAGRPDAPPPPAALAPVLRFARLPPWAMRTVLGVLDTDEGFRSRVADGLEEGQVDRAAWLFLARPDGWEEELAVREDAAIEEQRQADAGTRLEEAQRRAEQLEVALAETRAERDALGEQQSRERGELRALRAELEELRAEREELTARVDRLDAERARAVRELQEARELAQRRLVELRDRATTTPSTSPPRTSTPPAAPPPIDTPESGEPVVPAQPAGSSGRR